MEQKNRYLPAQTMNEYYYLNAGNEPQGPYSLDQLAGMMASGRINPTTLIACKGAASWEPLGTVLSRENIPTPDAAHAIAPGQVGNCPSCGHELSGDMKDGQLPATCPTCARSLWSGIPGINFWVNFKLAFKNYAKFSGRATRAEYWCFQLINGLIMLGIYMLILAISISAVVSSTITDQANANIDPDYATMSGEEFAVILIMMGGVGALFIWTVYTFIPNLSLCVRRMHDVGWSGKWLIPYAICTVLPMFLVVPIKLTENQELISILGPLAMLFQLVSYPFGIFLFVLMVLDSKRGPNKYGPSSKYPLG